MGRATSIIDAKSTSRDAGAARVSRRAGLTLAESLVAAVVLAVAVVGIMGPISASHHQSRAAEESSTCASLARQLMDEIAARVFVDPTDQSTTLGPEIDESTRAQFDNVDDFHGYRDSSDGSAGDRIKAVDGTIVTLQTPGVFQRSVAVEYRQTPAGPPVMSGDFALIRVVVQGEGGKRVVVNRLATRYPRK